MGCEQRLDFVRSRRDPIDVHPCPIPVAGEVIDGLRADRFPPFRSGVTQPLSQLGLRPEAIDVRSGEADVVPELPNRNQQMDQTVGLDQPIADRPHQAVGTLGTTVTE